jgi:multidrug efflux pump subunit AcrA (membrane-fusion protein)
MRHRAIATVTGAVLVITAAALGQGPPQAPANAQPAQQASVETADIAIVYPDRYAVPVVLEASRRIFLTAASDGILKSVAAPVGTNVKELQEIAQLDRSEANAKAKIAAANVKEAKADADRAKSGDGNHAVAQARLDAAEARAELAQIELDRCVLRAPFPGKILDAPVTPGQFVTKGNKLAELADYSVLKVLVPIDRTAVKVGEDLELIVEGKPHSGKVSALVPLPEAFATLRELATPWAAAWVTINNANGALEPGQRVRGPFAPLQPITAVPTRSLRANEAGDTLVQVIRFNNVLDIPVKVIGDAGFDRTQISGAFLATDAAIVASSMPLASGTVIRFNGDPPVSGASGITAGALVDYTPPVGAPVAAPTGRPVNRVAPIGSPDANLPKTAAKGSSGTGKAAVKTTTKPAAKPAAGGAGTPF